MKVQGKGTHDGLRAKRLEAHFLFGFLFSRLDFGSAAAKLKGRISRGNLEAHIQTAIKKDRCFRRTFSPKTTSIHFRTDAPEGQRDQNVVQYYILIDNPYLVIESKPLVIDLVEVSPDTSKITFWRKALLTKSIRLYESGMGLYRVTLRLGRPTSDLQLPAEDIISVAAAGSSERELEMPISDKKMLQFRRRNQKFNLFHEYHSDIGSLRSLMSVEVAGAYGDTLTGCMFRDLSWIEIDNGLVPEPLSQDQCFQNPYVLNHVELGDALFGELSASRRDKFGPKGNTSENNVINEQLEEDLQSVLLRRLEPWMTSRDYVTKYTQSIDGTLANMCVSSRAFVNLHIRSAAYVSNDTNEAREYTKSVLPVLIDTLELMRMRWYAYVVLNKYLDVHVGSLCSQAYLLSTGKRTESVYKELSKCQESIIRLKSEILRVVELPLSYRRASATATTVYDVGEDIFKIKELQDIVLQKINCLDRLFRNVHDLRRRIEFDRIEPEITKAIGVSVKKRK